MQLWWNLRNHFSHSEAISNNKWGLTIHTHWQNVKSRALCQAGVGAKHSAKLHWQSQLRISEDLQKKYDSAPLQSNASVRGSTCRARGFCLFILLKSSKRITEHLFLRALLVNVLLPVCLSVWVRSTIPMPQSLHLLTAKAHNLPHYSFSSSDMDGSEINKRYNWHKLELQSIEAPKHMTN